MVLAIPFLSNISLAIARDSTMPDATAPCSILKVRNATKLSDTAQPIAMARKMHNVRTIWTCDGTYLPMALRKPENVRGCRMPGNHP